MFYYYNPLLTTSGDILPDYLVRLLDASGNEVDIFADNSGTPIVTASGVANAAKADALGMVRFWVPNGTYDITIYDTTDTFKGSEVGVPMYDAGTLTTDLASDTGAGLVGSTGGITVQASLDARPTSAALSASGGSALVGFLQAGTGAVARTTQDKGRDVVHVKDFGASPSATPAENSAAIQAAIDYVYGLDGGGTVDFYADEGLYEIDAAISTGSRVHLRGPAIIKQMTDDTPILVVDKASFNTGFSIVNLELTYHNQQTAAQTNAKAIVVTDTSKLAWGFKIDDVRISKAAKGIDAPEVSGAFAFLACLRNIQIADCADWGLDWRNSTSGATTFLAIENLWVYNTNGAEIAGSKGVRISRNANLSVQSIAVDHIQAAPAVQFVSCHGHASQIGIESCDFAGSSGGVRAVHVSGGTVSFDTVTLTANTVDISGSADFIGLAVTDGGVSTCGLLFDNSNTLTDTSSGACYTAQASSTGYLKVEDYTYIAAGANPVPNANLADFSDPRQIRYFDGNARTEYRGTKAHVFRTAAPTSGTWAVGDTAWNTTPSTTTPLGWICTTAGTPGTWTEFGAPTSPSSTAANIAAVGNAINTAGKFAGKLVWDSTNNRMMRASGSAAADVWHVIDGSASVTPA